MEEEGNPGKLEMEKTQNGMENLDDDVLNNDRRDNKRKMFPSSIRTFRINTNIHLRMYPNPNKYLVIHTYLY